MKITPLSILDSSKVCVAHTRAVQSAGGVEGQREVKGTAKPLCRTMPHVNPQLETGAAMSRPGACLVVTGSHEAKQGRSHDVTVTSLPARYWRVVVAAGGIDVA